MRPVANFTSSFEQNAITCESNEGKRKTASHVEVPNPRAQKRQDTRGVHEKRLLGDYSAGPNAVKIAVPGAFAAVDGSREAEVEEVHEGKRSEGKMSRGKVGAGSSFKFGNTLNRPSPLAQKELDRNFPRFVEQGAAKRTTANSTSTYQRTHGIGRSGEGFTQKELGRDAPPPKKRKVDIGTGTDLQNDPIDVSDDEPSKPRVVSVNGRPVTKNSHAVRTQGMIDNPRVAPFESNEFKTVDDLTKPGQQKTRRKPANGNRSSQASPSLESPAVAMNGVSPPHVVDLVDENTSQELTQTQVQTQRKHSLSGSLPDVKAIGSNLDDYPTKRTAQDRQSGDSVEFISTTAKAQMAPRATTRSHAHPEQGKAQQLKRRQIRQEGDGAEPPIGQRARRQVHQNDAGQLGLTERYKQDKERRRSMEQTKDQNTRARFVRDTSTSHQPTSGMTSQRSRMKAESTQAGVKVKPVGESSDDEDELNGPTTVGSVSPEKPKNQTTSGEVQTNGARKTRSPSMSDLPPTQFTQSRPARPAQNERVGGAEGKRKKGKESDEWHEIPLANFYASSGVLTDGNITLRYDKGAKQLDVYCNGDVQVVPGRKCAVHIGKKEATQVVWNKDSKLILLKGSMDVTGVSNGSICLTLQDASDMSWFSDHISAITGDLVSWKAVDSADRIKKIFANKAVELYKAYEKRKATDAQNEKAAQSQQRSRWFADQEHIKYESEEPGKPNLRRGMRGEEIVDQQPPQTGLRSLASAMQSPYFQQSNVRRSTRQSKPVERASSPPPELPRWTQLHKPPRWPHPVFYPSSGARRVTVDFQDLERLDEGEFLNDNVISFALRQIEENMAPEQKDRVHFFNSFFYTALTTKGGKKAFNYEAVKRWTKGRDLLGCDYVVVPICIDLHWFVAVICNLPNLRRRAPGLEENEEEQADDAEAAKKKDGSISSDSIELSAAADASTTVPNTPDNSNEMRNLSISDKDATIKTLQPADEDDAPPTPQTQANDAADSPATNKKSTSAMARKGKKRGPPSYDPDKPAIITLDSFGNAHPAEIRYLKDYLRAEAESKREMTVETSELQGLNASGIPTQSNFCDCGVYLVGYVEQFAKDPRAFVTKALTRKLDKEADFAGFDPSRKRDEIRNELLELQRVQEAEHKAKKAGKKALEAKSDSKTRPSAAVTPKPESRPTSKAPSPAKDVPETALANAKQQHLNAKPSWSPGETTNSPAQAQAETSRNSDLEYSVPRALRANARGAGAEAVALQFSDSREEEMLDEPQHHSDHHGQGGDEEEGDESNELFDGLASAVEQSSQQVEASLVDQLQEAAAEASSEEPGRGGIVREEDIIDLGDEEDEVSAAAAVAEIPDSQEHLVRPPEEHGQ